MRLYLGPAVRPQLVNRLDRETSGVTLVAKDESAARELRRLWENREVRKEYLALVHGHVPNDSGVIDAPLGKDDQSRVAIKDCVRSDGAPARTGYQVERRFTRLPDLCNPGLEPVAAAAGCSSAFSLLRLVPHTGRKHQLRIHLAFLGHPIVGDKLYGLDEELYLALVENRLTEAQRRQLILPYHALHAAEVRFTWRRREHVFQCEPEPWFTRFVC